MPEYLAPGVYIEEVPSRAKSIEGVPTSTAGFIGAARFGPVHLEPHLVTSLEDFEQVHGGGDELQFHDAGNAPNFLWHAVRAFFAEGGRRLYISRVYQTGAGGERLQLFEPLDPDQEFAVAAPTGSGDTLHYADGHARAIDLVDRGLMVRARFPGAMGNWRVRFSLRAGATPGVATLGITLLSRDGLREIATWPDLALDPQHRQGGAGDSMFDHFSAAPASAAAGRSLPLVIARDPAIITSAADVVSALFDGDPLPQLRAGDGPGTEVRSDFLLDGGHDGRRPGAVDYQGQANESRAWASGLRQFEDIPDLSIVAAPGSTWGHASHADDAHAIAGLLIAHAERMRHRIAVLDSAQGQSIAEVRSLRARIDSTHAALYYPWVTVLDPITGNRIDLPPSGFVAGIYARNDVERGVHRAPANAVVRLALGFETLLSREQQEVLNPEGINCFRFFEGRGMRLWGARTTSSDPEWKYVSMRRYFAYLERSIENGTQWAVFEPNGEPLWGQVRRTIEDFLLNEFRNGALLGNKPEDAYFVRCDRSTMTQDDLDNGRLVCLVGVAPLKPAEFVIFRIGQWTADRKA